jgi:serine/threonine protein kinase
VLVRLRDVASGLAYLHSRNVLHGDLKAANVLLATSLTGPFGLVAKVRRERLVCWAGYGVGGPGGSPDGAGVPLVLLCSFAS